ncbi:MAG: hypothetical protein K2H37_08095 [Lachnospiraceae bacterium]|nr:hypothetical protein [Lachnospiraceae bacterium]
MNAWQTGFGKGAYEEMTFQDLTAVQKFDRRGKLLGTYNNIFIQNGCQKIKEDFVANVNVEEQHYESMLTDFDLYDGRVIANYDSCSIGGMTVYHVSYGQRGENSLSVFFRIYAVEMDDAGAFAQASGDELYFVAYINSGNGNTTIKLRRSDGEIPNLTVDLMTGIFSNDGRRYRAVMEIVGVGSHDGNGATYRLAARNENLFENSRLSL